MSMMCHVLLPTAHLTLKKCVKRRKKRTFGMNHFVKSSMTLDDVEAHLFGDVMRW